MKSIVQEASSIAKAVEQGWQKAGEPAHFSVKILELPEKNFFGFTTRSAKIALYFAEEVRHENTKDKSGYTKPKYAHERETREPKRQVRRDQRQEFDTEQPVHEVRTKRTDARKTESQNDLPATVEVTKSSQKRYEPLWNDHIITRLSVWLKGSLATIDSSDVNFTIEPQQFRLRITLSKPLLNNQEKERQLLASFAALMMETLRKEFKTGFRGHKIVITHA